MTSQLTPEHTTTLPKKTDETNERIMLQPWFWLAVFGVVAMVVLVATT